MARDLESVSAALAVTPPGENHPAFAFRIEIARRSDGYAATIIVGHLTGGAGIPCQSWQAALADALGVCVRRMRELP
jgi:hypothetical protein